METPWTEARVAALQRLIAEQMPFSQIAKRLRVSRNAAIGKANRLKIVARDASTQSVPAMCAGWRARQRPARGAWEQLAGRPPGLAWPRACTWLGRRPRPTRRRARADGWRLLTNLSCAARRHARN